MKKIILFLFFPILLFSQDKFKKAFETKESIVYLKEIGNYKAWLKAVKKTQKIKLKNGKYKTIGGDYLIQLISCDCGEKKISLGKTITYNKNGDVLQEFNYDSPFEYVIPDSIKKNPKTLDEYENLMNTIDDVYLYLTKCGVPKEDARFVLPNACETELNIAIDLHNFIHFENLRLCNRAQWEIRKVAELMRDAVIKEEPRLKKYIVPKCETHEVPYCTEKKSCKMHKRLNDIVKDEYKKVKVIKAEIHEVFSFVDECEFLFQDRE